MTSNWIGDRCNFDCVLLTLGQIIDDRSIQALGNERQCTPLPETSLMFSLHHISESTSALMGIDRRSNLVTSGAADVALSPRKPTVAERAVGQLDFFLWQTCFIGSFWRKRCKYSHY